jgi:hypothetical protein
MELSSLDELLRREPFQPFRLKFTNGDRLDIRQPHLVVATKRDLFIADADRDGFHLYSMLHLVGAESLHGNGSD